MVAADIISFAVGKNDPKALQDLLAAKFGLSKRKAKEVIDSRSVWVNRKCIWMARSELKANDVVEIPRKCVEVRKTRAVESAKPAPRQTSHIRILWQDENYLVVDKPSGLLSAEDPKSAEELLRRQENNPAIEAVHRLDRDTTGCLLLAKSRQAKEAAVEVFKTHKVAKVYHAIVAGRFEYARTKITAPLDGKEAVTSVKREVVGADASFLRIAIETGRTNQIRRHLASIRAPILGDRVFGLKNARDARLLAVARQMLHASGLSLPNPMKKGEGISCHSPLPADFRACLRSFGMGKKQGT